MSNINYKIGKYIEDKEFISRNTTQVFQVSLDSGTEYISEMIPVNPEDIGHINMSEPGSNSSATAFTLKVGTIQVMSMGFKIFDSNNTLLHTSSFAGPGDLDTETNIMTKEVPHDVYGSVSGDDTNPRANVAYIQFTFNPAGPPPYDVYSVEMLTQNVNYLYTEFDTVLVDDRGIIVGGSKSEINLLDEVVKSTKDFISNQKSIGAVNIKITYPNLSVNELFIKDTHIFFGGTFTGEVFGYNLETKEVDIELPPLGSSVQKIYVTDTHVFYGGLNEQVLGYNLLAEEIDITTPSLDINVSGIVANNNYIFYSGISGVSRIIRGYNILSEEVDFEITGSAVNTGMAINEEYFFYSASGGVAALNLDTGDVDFTAPSISTVREIALNETHLFYTTQSPVPQLISYNLSNNEVDFTQENDFVCSKMSITNDFLFYVESSKLIHVYDLNENESKKAIEIKSGIFDIAANETHIFYTSIDEIKNVQGYQYYNGEEYAWIDFWDREINKLIKDSLETAIESSKKNTVEDLTGNSKIWIGTQDEYDNLTEYHSTTLYFIKEEE